MENPQGKSHFFSETFQLKKTPTKQKKKNQGNIHNKKNKSPLRK
jgi:hypothetical protein